MKRKKKMMAVTVAILMMVVVSSARAAELYIITSPEDFDALVSLSGRAETVPIPDWPESQLEPVASNATEARDFSGYVVSEADVLPLAQTILGEAGSDYISKAEKAMVGWTILNRLDDGWGSSVLEVVSAPGQFAGYLSWATPPETIMELARDVLRRHAAEKAGEVNVGRVLPPGYCYFYGDGSHNYFSGGSQGTGYSFPGYESPY